MDYSGRVQPYKAQDVQGDKCITEYSSAVYRDDSGVASIIVYLRFMVYGTSKHIECIHVLKGTSG